MIRSCVFAGAAKNNGARIDIEKSDENPQPVDTQDNGRAKPEASEAIYEQAWFIALAIVFALVFLAGLGFMAFKLKMSHRERQLGLLRSFDWLHHDDH